MGSPMIFEISTLIKDILSLSNNAPISLYDQFVARNSKEVPTIHIIEKSTEESTGKVLQSTYDQLLLPAQGSPSSERRQRSKSRISFRWKKEKLFKKGRLGDIFHACNISSPEESIIVKEIIIPVAYLVSASFEASKVRTSLITNKIQSLIPFKHGNIASYMGLELIPPKEPTAASASSSSDLSLSTNASDHYELQILRQYIEGISLYSHVIERQYQPEIEDYASWSFSILKALEYLHSCGICHEHLNSNNVILSNQGNIILTDFGLEKVIFEAHKINEDNPHFFTKSHDFWNLGALLVDLYTRGEVDFYGMVGTDQKITIPPKIPLQIREFIKLCFKKTSTSSSGSSGSSNELINELFNSSFLQSNKTNENLYDEDGNDHFFSFSCEMPKDSSSRYESDFEEIEFIGRGGFGAVVKARNRLDGRLYAIKKVALDSDNFQENQQILGEVTTLARLHHEYVVRYYQAWIELNSSVTLQNSTVSDSTTDRRNSLLTCGENTNDTIHSLSFVDDVTDVDSELNTSTSTCNNSNLDDVLFQSRTIPDDFNDFDSDSSELEFCDPNANYSDEDDEEEEDDETEYEQVEYDDDNDATLDNKKENDDNDDDDLSSSSSGSFGGFESDGSLGLGEGSAILYIQMELCTENTLLGLINEKTLVNHSEKKWNLFRQIVEGLDHIHQQRMIHRDLKPANIFLDAKNNVKIGDFGLAKIASANIHDQDVSNTQNLLIIIIDLTINMKL